MIRSHWEIISKILFSESLSYGSMDLEKILEYFIRFESLPAKECAHPAAERGSLRVFFRANKSIPYSGYLASEECGPGRMQISGGGKTCSRLGKSISFRPCVFSTSPSFSPPFRVLFKFSFFFFIVILLFSYFSRFSFDYTSLLHHRRYAVVLLRLITVYCDRGNSCVTRCYARDLSWIRTGERQLVSITPDVITDAEQVSSF